MNYEKVLFEGIQLTIQGDVYSGDDGTEYVALATDEEGKIYRVFWEVNHPDYENLTDESDACDWENPVRITPA